MGLCVTRKNKERVALVLPDGRTCWVLVDQCQRGQCRVVVDAPADVRVWREEILPRGPTDGAADE